MNDEERDARLESLLDAIADTNRTVAALSADTSNAIAALAARQETTDRQLALLTTDIASLARLMRQHLVIDHGYPEIDETDEPDDDA